MLVDIVQSPNEHTSFGVKNMLYFYFEVEEKMNDGRPFLVKTRFTESLNPKANLYKFLKKWRGQDIKPGETINLSKLVGTGCVLEVENEISNAGNQYAVVDRARALAEEEWPAPSGHYDGERIRGYVAENAERARERYGDLSEESGFVDDKAKAQKTLSVTNTPAKPKTPVGVKPGNELPEDDDVPF